MCYWCKERNECSEDLLKAEIQVKTNYELSLKDLHWYVLQNKEILGDSTVICEMLLQKPAPKAVSRED
jgi:hypothetical protein